MITESKLFEIKKNELFNIISFQLILLSIDSCIYQLLKPTTKIVSVIRTAVISFCVTRFSAKFQKV